MLSTSLLLIVPQILLASDASVVSEKLLSISTNDHLQECCLFVSFVFSFFVFLISNMKQTANLQEQREDPQGGSFQLQTSPQHFRKYRPQQTLSDILGNKSPFKTLGIMYEPLGSKFEEALLECSQGQMSQSFQEKLGSSVFGIIEIGNQVSPGSKSRQRDAEVIKFRVLSNTNC